MRKALIDIAMRFANVAPAALEAKSSHSPLRRPSVKSGCSSSMTPLKRIGTNHIRNNM